MKLLNIFIVNFFFVSIANAYCSKGYASVEEVTAFVRKSGISKVELKVSNVQSILDTLVYDGKIEIADDPRGALFGVRGKHP